MPLIHGPDGAKLSKRHGALGVEAYRAMGYLPAALRNYLARLGWSHGDDEIFSTEQMIDWFDLDAIGRSAARFDFAKLENLNGHYIRATPDAELVEALEALVPELPRARELARQDRRRQAGGSSSAPCPASRSAPRRLSSSSTVPTSLRHAPAHAR